MDQLKEILKQAIKYRFWIAVGLSALLPLIAYFVGKGPVQAKALAESAAITSADTSAKKYASGTVHNAPYKAIVAEKTEDLTKDVDATWRKLYARQAPLLTWPERVHDRFTKWGRKWPENVDASAVQIAIVDYINAYPTFVTEVYKSFRPFDPEKGEGVVAAPPEAVLLRPATFTVETPPGLGKIWAAQERLWIQRTLLDVVSQVNASAKNWDGATIKQIEAIEVGSATAQDQRSVAKGEALEEAPDIVDPSKPVEEAADTAAANPMADMMKSRMGGMGGMGMLGGAGGAAPETVQYIHTDSTEFKIMPVQMTVLIEQDRIQDFLVALENSPMNIQVMDFEMAKPQARVTKPVQGQSMAGYGMGGMMGGMAMMRGMSRGMGGYGGNMARMGGMMGMMGNRGGGEGMMGMMGGMGRGAEPARKGVDKRSENRAKKREDEEKAAKNAPKSTLHDPYYNIVEVTVYGQARFFNPPAVTPAEPSQSDAAGDAEAKTDEPKAEGAAKAKTDEPKAEAAAEARKDEPKAETTKDAAETKKDEAKAAAEPKKDEAKADEEPKAKAEAPKGEADTPKAKDAAPAPAADAPKKDAAPKDAPK